MAHSVGPQPDTRIDPQQPAVGANLTLGLDTYRRRFTQRDLPEGASNHSMETPSTTCQSAPIPVTVALSSLFRGPPFRRSCPGTGP
jgi:hypothetical protein